MRVAQLVERLGGTSRVAALCDVKLPVVSNWKVRNSIPAPYWRAIVREAENKDIAGITYDLLSRIAAANSHSVTKTGRAQA
jgi:hypothetical protein